jgi:choline dehydrogenase-like flavoprotein
MASFEYGAVFIGSGFGGNVAAVRAAEKGYRVGVMEAGKRSIPSVIVRARNPNSQQPTRFRESARSDFVPWGSHYAAVG